MARQLNFKYRIRLCSDNEYGNEQADGTWVNKKDLRRLSIFLERDDRRGDSSKGAQLDLFCALDQQRTPNRTSRFGDWITDDQLRAGAARLIHHSLYEHGRFDSIQNG